MTDDTRRLRALIERANNFLGNGGFFNPEMMQREAAGVLVMEMRNALKDQHAVDTMERIGRDGLTISVCCGPCGAATFRWTVQVLARDGSEFDRPFAAENFDHAIRIALIEIQQRGWNQPLETQS